MECKGKIVFYEDRNFQGRYYECNTDCPELNTHFSRCNSVCVESGAWVLYERPNYLGYQYVLTRGEYPDYHRWMGYNDSVRSCRMIRNVSDGKNSLVCSGFVFTSALSSAVRCWSAADVNNLPERLNLREIHSVQVHDGAWIFFELPNYRGRQYLLEKGDFRRFTEWGAMNPNVGSIRRAYDL